MQFVKNNCFLLNPEKNFDVDPSCRFREKRKKRTMTSEKWRHRAEGYSNKQLKVVNRLKDSFRLKIETDLINLLTV